MKFYIKNLAPLLFTLVIVCLPVVSLAAVETSSGGGNFGIPTAPGGGVTGIPSVSNNSSSFDVQNPLKVTNFCDLLKIVLQAILIIGLPVAVVFLVIVGFKFILAQGNPE